MKKKEQEIYKGYYSNHTARNIYIFISVKKNSGDFKYLLKRIMLKILDYILAGIVSAVISVLLQ